jgi:hypothetical protein
MIRRQRGPSYIHLSNIYKHVTTPSPISIAL